MFSYLLSLTGLLSNLPVSLYTAWKLSKYGPEITPYLGTFYAVVRYNPHAKSTYGTLFFSLLNEEYFIPVFITQSKKLTKENFIWSKYTKMNEDSCLTLVPLVSVKSVFLKKEDLLCISEMVSLWTLLHKIMYVFFGIKCYDS